MFLNIFFVRISTIAQSHNRQMRVKGASGEPDRAIGALRPEPPCGRYSHPVTIPRAGAGRCSRIFPFFSDLRPAGARIARLRSVCGACGPARVARLFTFMGPAAPRPSRPSPLGFGRRRGVPRPSAPHEEWGFVQDGRSPFPRRGPDGLLPAHCRLASRFACATRFPRRKANDYRYLSTCN